MPDIKKGTPVIIKQLGLRGVVINVVEEHPPGHDSAEVLRDYDGLSARYLVENLERIEDD